MSRIVTGVLSLLMVALLSASVAVAADAKGKGGKRQPQSPEQAFKVFDKNGDGSISLEEFKESPLGKRLEGKADEVFKRMDANGDGKVSLEEFKTAQAKRAEQAKNKKKN